MHPSVVVCLLFFLVPGAYAQESTEDVVPGVPFKEGDRYFYTYNPGLLNQSQLFTANELGGDMLCIGGRTAITAPKNFMT